MKRQLENIFIYATVFISLFGLVAVLMDIQPLIKLNFAFIVLNMCNMIYLVGTDLSALFKTRAFIVNTWLALIYSCAMFTAMLFSVIFLHKLSMVYSGYLALGIIWLFVTIILSYFDE